MEKPKAVPIRKPPAPDADVRQLLEGMLKDADHISAVCAVVQYHDGSFALADVGERDVFSTHGMLSALALDVLAGGEDE